MMKAFNLLFYLFIWSNILYAQGLTSSWFTFEPKDYLNPNAVDLSNWLDAPAGKHGFVQMQGKDLVFENGIPVKFWGTNIASDKPFMDHQEAEIWAGFLAKYGFNGIRFHKFTWNASDNINSTIITEDKWKNFDYLCHQLREKGIYYGWSHIYGHRVRPGDSSRIVAYEEIAATQFPWSHLNGSTASLVNFAEDLQKLNIELTVNMLDHVNPHTGLKYAEDPALGFIELQNEDNIFWGAIERTLEQTPTYKALLCEKFSDWLIQRYGDHESLLKAWNHEGLETHERLEKKNVYPKPNHDYFSREYEQALKNKRPPKQHVVDKINFLFDEQVKFYDKFSAAIRSTGYKGLIIGSCWQAGEGLSHLYNLYADYQVGLIDRHNYSGGGEGHNLSVGKFNNEAMVSQIGSGLLGTGLQQISDRPFAISEWMSLIPNEWTAESAPIVAAYGMGLQGWDASFSFATDYPHYTPTIQTPPWNGIYNTTAPTQLALYPALAMMIYRNDLKEGETVVDRKIDLKKLQEGSQFFDEKLVQDHDRKVFKSSFPIEAMAKGKVTLTFTEEDKTDSTSYSDLNPESGILSNTSQLYWSKDGRGYFTIDTEGTKGIVGFPGKNTFDLTDITISTSNEFAVIFISSLERDAGISSAKRLLISTVARARNSGMEYDQDKKHLLQVGKSPIELEAVDLRLQFKRKGKCRVYVLDHTGNRTGKTFASKNKSIQLSGSQHKAIYYEIEFE